MTVILMEGAGHYVSSLLLTRPAAIAQGYFIAGDQRPAGAREKYSGAMGQQYRLRLMAWGCSCTVAAVVDKRIFNRQYLHMCQFAFHGPAT